MPCCAAVVRTPPQIDHNLGGGRPFVRNRPPGVFLGFLCCAMLSDVAMQRYILIV